MISESKNKLNVILEHFSFEMQGLLDGYQDGSMTLDQVVHKYNEIGTEGHDIALYKDLFEHAKENKNQIKLVAGFIPRSFARTMMRQGEAGVIKDSLVHDYLDPETKNFVGSEFHYNMFESMISGRDMHDENMKPNDQYRRIFQA